MSKEREVRRRIQPVMVTLRCGKCDGEMHSAGHTRPVSPPQHLHRCDKCRTEEWISGTTYPHIEYEEERGFGASHARS